MANVKKMVDDVLGTINGALAILDKIPKVEETDGNFDFGLTISPFTLIGEVLKNIKGVDIILDWLSEFLIIGLVPLEVAVKTLLTVNLKGLITCSLNPIIPDQLLLDGIVFDLREIDIFNTLSYSPLSDNGKHYYFGCTQAKIPDDLRLSQDFNALLWYMVNRSNCREIWSNCSTNIFKNVIGEVGSAWGNALPLKDISCVDIDLSNKDENGKYINDQTGKQWEDATWGDIFNMNPQNDNTQIHKIIHGNDTEQGFLYTTKDGFEFYAITDEEQKDKYEYIERNESEFSFINIDGETPNKTNNTFKENDIIYKYEIQKYKGRNNLILITHDCILLNKTTIRPIEIENKKYYCGLLDNTNDFDISKIVDYKVQININDNVYYYCDESGYIINVNNNKKKVKFPLLTPKFKMEKNLLTGKYKTIRIGKKNVDYKLKKSAGILTLEYNETSSTITNAEGNATSAISLPYNNCLHVFIGNTQPSNYGEIMNLRNQIRINEQEKRRCKVTIDNFNDRLRKNEDQYRKDIESLNKNHTSNDNKNKERIEDNYNKTKDFYQQGINLHTNKINECDKLINSYETLIYACDKQYRKIEHNYYYRRTLIEFNFDYVWSLKLFDPRVIVTQLLDSLFNCSTINLGLSYEQIFLHDEIKEMVNKIIETDDAEVNDCFFTFSNEQYNNLIIQSEKKYKGIYSTHPNQKGIKIDTNSIYNRLNQIDPTASKEKQQTVIKGILQDIKGEISSIDGYSEDEKLNLFSNFNAVGKDFIENLLTNLATVLVQTILSPKVYLLLAVNMKIVGGQTDVTIEMLIAKLKHLIVELIRKIRDMLLDFLTTKLMEIIKDLSFEIGNKLAIEQAAYYYNLIMKLINCFRQHRQTLGFTVDEVNYADIYAQEPTPPTTEC